MPDRLFLPLNTDRYDMFFNGSKTWEIRGESNRFNIDTVRTGRAVEIRKGYQKKGALWGKIGRIQITSDIFNLSKWIYDAAIPTSDRQLLNQIRQYNYKYDKFIVFEVILDETR